jgi:hypothetical protein
MNEPQVVKVRLLGPELLICMLVLMTSVRVQQGLFSVSTTSTKDPHAVLQELKRVIGVHENLKLEENG